MNPIELRDLLCTELRRIASNEGSLESARVMVSLANAVSQNMAVQLKVIKFRLQMGLSVQGQETMRIL